MPRTLFQCPFSFYVKLFLFSLGMSWELQDSPRMSAYIWESQGSVYFISPKLFCLFHLTSMSMPAWGNSLASAPSFWARSIQLEPDLALQTSRPGNLILYFLSSIEDTLEERVPYIEARGLCLVFFHETHSRDSASSVTSQCPIDAFATRLLW